MITDRGAPPRAPAAAGARAAQGAPDGHALDFSAYLNMALVVRRRARRTEGQPGERAMAVTTETLAVTFEDVVDAARRLDGRRATAPP